MATPTPPAADGSSPQQRKFDEEPPMIIDTDKRYVATMVTSHGTMVIALDPLAAPKTVNSFVFLARYHYYDGIVFHRIIPGFVLQGGDPTGTGSGGPGYRFADELPAAGRYKVGSLAMANAGPNTNGSQFFVISGPDGVRLPPLYSLFGEVVSGHDVVATIDAIGTASGHADRAGRDRERHHRREGLERQLPATAGPRSALERAEALGRRAADEDGRRPRALVAPGPVAVADQRGAGRERHDRQRRPGAMATVRSSFWPWASSCSSPKWGTTARLSTRPRPRVSAPPRGSTMGSVSTMAPGPGPGHHGPARPGLRAARRRRPTS